jgi:5-hydroxyisourate hydrolase
VSAITTHVLDTSIGRPAVGVSVVLERGKTPNGWQVIGSGRTDSDGRVRTLMDEATPVGPGTYRLVFDTRGYFDARGVSTFYPTVIVTFDVSASADGPSHYHVPLLMSPFGYATYRGS